MTLKEGFRRDKGELGHTPVTAAVHPFVDAKGREKGGVHLRAVSSRQADTPRDGHRALSAT
ncbi:hypothetical protein GCM10018771_17300 [Streptomyces cellulosae]|nr:hypothetical protein GCM10018771_17300 [Streptomyces cellulosae]